MLEKKVDFAKMLIEARKKALSTFENHPKIIYLGTINGIHYLCDRNGYAIENSLDTLKELEGPLVWIFGNDNIGHYYGDFSDVIAEKIKAVICINRNCDNLLSNFKDDVDFFADARTMDIAVRTSTTICNQGDVVLFSPGVEHWNDSSTYDQLIEEFTTCIQKIKEN